MRKDQKMIQNEDRYIIPTFSKNILELQSIRWT